MNTPPVTPRRNRIRQSSVFPTSTPSTTFTATPTPKSPRPPGLSSRKRKSGEAGFEDDDEKTIHPLMYLDRLGGSTDLSKTSRLTLSDYLKEADRISQLPLILSDEYHSNDSSSILPSNLTLLKAIASHVNISQTCLPCLPSKIMQGRNNKAKGHVIKLICTGLRSYGGNLSGLRMGRNGTAATEKRGQDTTESKVNKSRRPKAPVEEKEAELEMNIWDVVHERGLPRDMNEVEEWKEEWGRTHLKEKGVDDTLKKEENNDGRTALGRKIKKTKVEVGTYSAEPTMSTTRVKTRTTNNVVQTTIQPSKSVENIGPSLSILTLQLANVDQIPTEPPKKKRQRDRASGQSNTIGWTTSKLSTGSGSVKSFKSLKSGNGGMKGNVVEGFAGKEDEVPDKREQSPSHSIMGQGDLVKESSTIAIPVGRLNPAVPSATSPQRDLHPLGTSLESSDNPINIPIQDAGSLGDDEMEPTQTDEETMTGIVGEMGDAEVIRGTMGCDGLEAAAKNDVRTLTRGHGLNIVEPAVEGLDLSFTGLHDVSILDEGEPMAMEDVILFPPSFPEGLTTSTPKQLLAMTAPDHRSKDPPLPSRSPSPVIHVKRTPTKSSLPSTVRRRIAIDSDSEGDDHLLDPPTPGYLANNNHSAFITSQASSLGPIPTSSFAQQPTQRVRDRAHDTGRAALQILGMDVMDL